MLSPGVVFDPAWAAGARRIRVLDLV